MSENEKAKHLPGIHGPNQASLLSSSNLKHELSSDPEGSLMFHPTETMKEARSWAVYTFKVRWYGTNYYHYKWSHNTARIDTMQLKCTNILPKRSYA